MLPCDPGAQVMRALFHHFHFCLVKGRNIRPNNFDDESRFKKKYRDANFNAALTFSRPKFEHVFRRNLFCSTINLDQSGKLNDFRIRCNVIFTKKDIQ